MARKTHWISISKDSKLGLVPCSYSPKSTCPANCPLLTGGCYAWGLFYLGLLGSKIENETIKIKSLVEALSERRESAKVVRHRVAGDVVGDIEETLEECRIIEREGLINLGYSHFWQDKTAQPLKPYFRASCSDVSEVIKAREMGWAATLIVPEGTSKKLILPNNEVAFLCPARHGVEGKKDITCNSCTLCKVDDKTRAKTVMFEVHGSNATLKKARGKIGKVS